MIIIFQQKNSPIKTCIVICILSILIRISCYITSKSLFPTVRIIISFSSGIIIIFSYCASICNYEATTNKDIRLILIIIITTITLIFSKAELNNNQTSNLEKSCIITSSINLVILMFCVIIIIYAINICILSPRKKIIKSY